MRRRVLLAVGLMLAAGVLALTTVDWRPLRAIWARLGSETPHQRYSRSLLEGGLAHTALATEWLAAATRALVQPAELAVPFTEDALIDPAKPVSLGYAVTLKRGQRLDAQVKVTTDTPGRLFIDLFEPDTEGRPGKATGRERGTGRDGPLP